MPTTHMTSTVRMNPDWARQACDERGGIASFAEAINADRSTVYRHLSGETEAGPRLIGAVLKAFPVLFNDPFDVIDVPVSKRRTYEDGQQHDRLTAST